ncbi:MAG: GNAT family N-acetyltransferase [Actinobacteria bacterium]|nr:GNAT family N-acetyltransferase [Actinomycetota bacterium]
MISPEVRPLRTMDANRCDAIIASLPYHFGLEEGRLECAAAVRGQDGLVAVVDGLVIGFLTFVRHYDAAAEITWMAVHAEHRRRGVGHRLLDGLCRAIASEGRRLLLVLTVSASDTGSEPEDGYQSTRSFYRSVGFVLGRDLPGYWTDDTPVLMVRPLGLAK